MRSARRALAPSERERAASQAARHFLRDPRLTRARRIAAYVTHDAEQDTLPLIEALLSAGRDVYVPRALASHALHLVQLGHATRLRPGRHGIPVPAGPSERALLRHLDVIVLPLLAFDAQGRRLGSGAGYYDRLVAGRRSARKPLLVGYAYAMQAHDALPEDPWDQRLDAVVTERGVTWFR